MRDKHARGGSDVRLGVCVPAVVSGVQPAAPVIGENFQAEFDVTLGADGFDGGCLELFGEGQDGGVNVAVAGQPTTQPLYLQTLRVG